MNYMICVGFLMVTEALTDGKWDKSSHSHKIIFPSTDEIQVNYGDEIKIECKGDSKLKWKYPNEPPKTVLIKNGFENGEYLSELKKSYANGSDVGYYECLNEKNQSVSVYVFVNGTDSLFVPPKFAVTALQYKNVTIPCRPTQKDVVVRLVHNGEEIDLRTNQWKFDNKIGFIHDSGNFKLNGDYDCCAKAAGIEEDCEYVNLEVLKHTDNAPKPHLSEKDIVVNVGDNVTLTCTVGTEETIKFHTMWIFPNKSKLISEKYELKNKTRFFKERSVRYHEELLTLKIYNVSRQDEGDLVCLVRDHMLNVNNQSASLKVMEDGETVLKIKEGTVKNIAVNVHQDPQWVIEYYAYPMPDFEWHDPHYNKIINSTKFIVVQTPQKIKLKILNADLNDTGTYHLELNNGVKEEFQLNLTVSSPPIVILPEERKYYEVDKNYTVHCKIYSFPLPSSIKWYYKQCDQLLNSCNGTLKVVDERHYKNTEIEKNCAVSSLNITATKNTYLTCNASNKHGNGEKEFLLMVTDVPGGFRVIQDPPDVIVGDKMKLTCMVTKQDFSETVIWYKISTGDGLMYPVSELKDKYIELNSTKFSYHVSVIFPNVSVDDSGEYVCQFNPVNPAVKAFTNLTQNVTVMEPQKPFINNDTMLDGKVHHLKPLSPFHLKCVASGTPHPSIYWFKDGKELKINKSDPAIEYLNNKTIINIKHFQESFQGDYECKAKNRIGSAVRSATLTIEDESGNFGYIIGVVIIAIILVITIVILCIKIREERKQQRILSITGLQNFKEGAVQNMNCEQTVDEQAELLPYDKKWEFPRDKLKLGKQLGSGAFGVVMKAEAYGIVEGEHHTTVAVKMVKRNASYTYMKALASELKIMVHLGKHLNVVNLLGACTNNITKMELLVIVEYCRYGNLHNYLLRHRQEFIDQVDPNTGLVDPNIGAEAIARANSFSKKNKIKYADLSFAPNHSGEVAVDYRIGLTPSTSSTGSDTEQVSMEPGGEDGCILSNNSVQPEWRSNYRGDYRDGVRLICTRDLICWAFQVARGMEYLAARKVLHGDLAARNILLAEDNIVKICDFGLAKSMYKSDNYKKKGDGPLPVKWMAIESIRDRVFSTQSDVWSYGIVLWEFFSLARTPYPGMEADEKLYNNIVNGYRMEKPDYATLHVYQTMLDCWNYNPNKRPTFSMLSEALGNMLEESVRRHYIDLNDPYIDMNAEWLKSNENDYLSMMSAPTYGNLVSPIEDQDNGYINSPVPGTSSAGDDSGYLCMKSPTSCEAFNRLQHTNGTVFDFGTPTQRRLLAQEAGEGLELRPMLRNNSDSDVDQPSVSSDLNKRLNNSPNFVPIIKNINGAPCISNPGYQCVTPIPPVTDNYINMPQSKQMLKDKDQCQIDDGTVMGMSVSNPSYMDVDKLRTPQISHTSSYSTNDKYVNLPKP